MAQLKNHKIFVTSPQQKNGFSEQHLVCFFQIIWPKYFTNLRISLKFLGSPCPLLNLHHHLGEISVASRYFDHQKRGCFGPGLALLPVVLPVDAFQGAPQCSAMEDFSTKRSMGIPSKKKLTLSKFAPAKLGANQKGNESSSNHPIFRGALLASGRYISSNSPFSIAIFA